MDRHDTPTVLCWDIDGTLLTTARAGVFALEEAAREVCGGDVDLQELKTAGLTDAQIARLVVELHGPGDAAGERAPALLRAYERLLPERLHWRKGAVLPGVMDALDYLDARPDVVTMLLTGNTPLGAEAKLRHYGLAGYFTAGAFCADGDDRERIARRALDIARDLTGVADLPGERVVVIGDTPHDVRCGRVIDARTVAVASGAYTLAELQACAPTAAVERLPPPERLAALLGLSETQARSGRSASRSSASSE